MALVHQKSLEGLYTVISNLSPDEEKIASHPCGNCCRNFSSARVRSKIMTLKFYFIYSYLFTAPQ